MKKSKFISVLISAVLVAFMAALVLCMSFGNVSETAYNAKAEESATEQPEGEQEGSQIGETEQGGETPAGNEETQPGANDDVQFDLDAFLAYVQKYADQAGIGDDYAKAVEAIKTAASKKQVTLSTIACVAEFVAFFVFIIYSKHKNGSLKKSMIELSEKLDLQVKGTNGLIDGSNANGQTATETKQEVGEMKNDIKALKSGLAYLLSGLSSFVERFNIGAASKESVKREFNRAVKEIDGEPTETIKEKADDEDKA